MDIALRIKDLSLHTQRAHCMQDKVLLAREFDVRDIESVCKGMRKFSEKNTHIVHQFVIRPFTLQFGKFFKQEDARGRWPTIGEVNTFININFADYLDPSVIQKLTTDYRLRKVASEISAWAEYMNARVGNLKNSERICELSEMTALLQGYNIFLHKTVYGADIIGLEKELSTLREDIRDLRGALHSCEVALLHKGDQ